MRQTKVAIVLPSLVGGGAERVAIELANHWSQQSHEVALVTIDRSEDSHYGVDAQVHRIGLDLMAPSRNLLKAASNNLVRVTRLRDALKKLQSKTVVSFLDITNVTALLATRPLGLRAIVCERTDPRHHQIGTIWRWLRRRTYGRASALVVQTNSVRQWALSQGWKCPVIVIPNAAPDWPTVCRQSAGSNSAIATGGRKVIALGRLSEEKGFHQLIEAFSRVAAEAADWQLIIFGEGSERSRLQEMVQRSELTSRVLLPGWTEDVPGALASADLFVLPSRYEGFPNALLEAMATGLPVISFDCDSGPREIIRDQLDGMLVPPGDVAALADTMRTVMTDELLRQRLGKEAEQVRTRFSREEFYRRWDEVLDCE